MAARGGATVLDDLPDWIVVEEILIRLPPTDILRCRAVRKWWRTATSSDKFLLDHRRRQPWLPLIIHAVDHRNRRIVLFDGLSAGASSRFLYLLRYTNSIDQRIRIDGVCDGLLIATRGRRIYMCNPVTRQSAPIRKPPLHGYCTYIAGFYRHPPSEEYRLLWVSRANLTTYFYTMAVGSDNARCIRQVTVPKKAASMPPLDLALREGLPYSCVRPPVHHRGSLQWEFENHHGLRIDNIVVFDTAAETFRLMRCPAHVRSQVLEMDGTLALCAIGVAIDVWVMQDYDAQAWSYKYRVNMSGMEWMSPRMSVLNNGDLLVQFSPRRAMRYDIDGRLLGHVEIQEAQDRSFWITRHYLQESLIPLPVSYKMQEEGGVSVEPPFFQGI